MKKILFIFLFLIPVIFPLFTKEILGSADNLAHLFRLVNLDRSISEGNLFPRWAGLAGHGLGAPVFNFIYLLPYYLTELIHLLGFGFLLSSEIFMAITIIFSSFFMYLFLKEYLGEWASLVGSIVYAYIPYHLLSIYLYGDWGEILSFVVLPMLFWAVTKLSREPKRLWIFLTIVSYAAFILTHNLFVLISSVVLITFIPFMGYKNKKSLLFICYSLISAILVTAWFWLPALFESRYINYVKLAAEEAGKRNFFFQSVAPIVRNSLDLLLLKQPGYYSFAIGIPNLVIAIVSLLYCFIVKFSPRGFTPRGQGEVTMKQCNHRIMIFSLFWFFFSLFLTRASSAFLWNNIPGMNMVAYPYRFLFINTFMGAILSGIFIDYLLKSPRSLKLKTFAFCLLIFAFIWQGFIYTRPKIDYFNFPTSYFQTEQTGILAPWTFKSMAYTEFLPPTADTDLLTKLDQTGEVLPKVEIIEGRGNIKVEKNITEQLAFNITSEEGTKVRVNTFYFPGWIGKIDQSPVLPGLEEDGRMSLNIPKGIHKVEVFFGGTPIRSTAKILSIVSLIFLSLIYFKRYI
ncbi:MAG: hypothetical protein UT63_C0029G0013 [Candidatus Gottesmanbacteria bacterium GW2011_GWC2_39_8]|uniref:Membrane protein 6-pyruvoyl-tetrahydropterin synthase-related domain-containing protein n=1 Tax=Candidatus Gottesmanbacteria bacterium GW2011_GWC2_39_8 TaxID=1618450 RepID=A0A0G0PYB4_9BACT|nr:MAG: hypothetical protein UT63_C0029G0013 [Candidatus Gottesmanbacteria bacterium GW2011_GWC2_39_8]